MKYFITIICLIFVVMTLVLFSCHSQNSDKDSLVRDMQRPSTSTMTFSHELHKQPLEKAGFDCFVCHPMNIEVEDKEEIEIEELIKASKQTFFPGKETCHFCHYNTQSGNIAPNKCSICHINPRDVQPANHNFNWAEKHAVFSKADSISCESCHSQTFCNDCHKRRDIPTLRVHDRNFRFIHGIEARANPTSCGKCHQAKSFCESCHIKGGYDF